ncbi:hypothetical protein [uncultured Actinomyces sp.]|jgi:hypothetical protein|uniref:hypothetical protein n=1 Tax=uncultured Actinomyces sp. TaxID=249061 RepID=UPI00261786A7|nr:hypothetical protein [uncultured Actinomyces sp.]
MSENPSNDRTLLVEVLPNTITCTVRATDRLTRIRAMVAVLMLLDLPEDQAAILNDVAKRLTGAQINMDAATGELKLLLDELEKDTK